MNWIASLLFTLVVFLYSVFLILIVNRIVELEKKIIAINYSIMETDINVGRVSSMVSSIDRKLKRRENEQDSSS